MINCVQALTCGYVNVREICPGIVRAFRTFCRYSGQDLDKSLTCNDASRNGHIAVKY